MAAESADSRRLLLCSTISSNCLLATCYAIQYTIPCCLILINAVIPLPSPLFNYSSRMSWFMYQIPVENPEAQC